MELGSEADGGYRVSNRNWVRHRERGVQATSVDSVPRVAKTLHAPAARQLELKRRRLELIFVDANRLGAKAGSAKGEVEGFGVRPLGEEFAGRGMKRELEVGVVFPTRRS